MSRQSLRSDLKALVSVMTSNISGRCPLSAGHGMMLITIPQSKWIKLFIWIFPGMVWYHNDCAIGNVEYPYLKQTRKIQIWVLMNSSIIAKHERNARFKKWSDGYLRPPWTCGHASLCNVSLYQSIHPTYVYHYPSIVWWDWGEVLQLQIGQRNLDH